MKNPSLEDVQKQISDIIDAVPGEWFVDNDGQGLVLDPKRVAALVVAAKVALKEMCNTVAPRDSFTDAVDALDAALRPNYAAENLQNVERKAPQTGVKNDQA